MDKLDGLSVADTITKVKSAINEVQKEGKFDNLSIDKIELTLKVLSEKNFYGDFKFKIPFIDTEVGFDGNDTKSGTQTIILNLVPDMQERFVTRGIKEDLVQAISLIGEGIRNASEGEPKYKLQDSSIELNFVINKSGNIALIFKGGMRSEITNTLKLYLKPKA